MATKDWNGFKKSGDTYIPNDATARAGLQNKVDKVSGKGLSTNDYTNEDKAKVTNAIQWADAEKSVQRNIFNPYNVSAYGASAQTITEDGKNIRIVSTSNGQYRGIVYNLPVKPNTNYKIKSVVSITSGKYVIKTQTVSGTTIVESNPRTTNDTVTLSFNSGNNELIKFALFITWDVASAGDVTFSDTVITYANAPIDFVPYIPDNTELFPRSEQAVLGAKNRLPFPYKETTKTQNGVTFTVNADRSITVNGTATANTVFNLIGEYSVADSRLSDLRGSYTIDIKNAIPSGTGMAVNIRTSVGTNLWAINTGQSKVTVNSTDTEHFFGCMYIYIPKDTVISNLTIKPQIYLSNDTYEPYADYAMTNKELTEKMLIENVEATTDNTHVSLDSSIKYFVRQGNVVNFNIRFTTDAAITANYTELFAMPFIPILNKQYFSLKDRNAPFKEVVGCFVDDDNKMKIHNTTLAAGSYQVTGMYLCK